MKMARTAFGLIAALAAGTALAKTPTMGCAWYPEAWEKERRATDLDLMQAAGIDAVRICEFNWAGFEPQEGAFDFADFRTVLDELARRKMKALMCTATAAPPRWFFEKYPEAWKVTDTGLKRMPVEHRRQYCVNNPDFRRRARALTEAQVAAFAGHPAIDAWQIDNELSSDAEGGHCTCRHCAVAFRDWLRRKYGTLENLNRAWNGAFWSNAVQDWEQVKPPFVTMIPVFRFDYARFQADSFQAFTEEQAAIVRARDSRPVCYNSWMSFQGDFDLPKFTKNLDFTACDTYLGQDYMQVYRATWDLYRGLKRQPFTVAETGPFNSLTARDNGTDFLRPAYWEMFAHGADSVYWFRWRRSVMGEEACRSIVQHDGRPGRSYGVIANARREFLDVLGKTGALPLPEAKVAVLYNAWDFQFGRSEDKSMPAFAETVRHYAALRSTGLGVDLVPVTPEADLSRYALVVAPRCEHLTDGAAGKLRDYVEMGGVLHASARFNVREDSSSYRQTASPHGLTDVLGLSVREYCGIVTRQQPSFVSYKEARDLPDGKFTGMTEEGEVTVDKVMEDVELRGAKALASHPHGIYKGAPLHTEHAFGRGRAFYQTAGVDLEAQKRFLAKALAAAGLKPVADLPDSVSRIRRGNVVFYTNVLEEPVTFGTSDVGDALLGAAPAAGKLTLPAYGVTVLLKK